MCVVYTNDPIRIKISVNDLMNLTHKKGIDSCAYPCYDEGFVRNEYFIKFMCSDLNPHNPKEEKYKEDIDREIENLNVAQDHIREFAPYRLFNSTKSLVRETILDEKIFSKENRYDLLLDKALNVHRLPNGKLFGIIENE